MRFPGKSIRGTWGAFTAVWWTARGPTDASPPGRTEGGWSIWRGTRGVLGPGRTRGLRRPLPGLCLETWWRGEGVSPHAVGTGGNLGFPAGALFLWRNKGKNTKGKEVPSPWNPILWWEEWGKVVPSGRGLACGLQDQRLMARPPARAGGRSGLLTVGESGKPNGYSLPSPKGYLLTSPARPAGGRAVTSVTRRGPQARY